MWCDIRLHISTYCHLGWQKERMQAAPTAQKTKGDASPASGKTEQPGSMYVPRNTRQIQQRSSVHRSAKGVGVSLFKNEVEPVLTAITRHCLLSCLASHRCTLKERHLSQAYDSVFNGEPLNGETPLPALTSSV